MEKEVKDMAEKISKLYGDLAANDFIIHFADHVKDEKFMENLLNAYKEINSKKEK